MRAFHLGEGEGNRRCCEFRPHMELKEFLRVRPLGA